MQRFTIACAQFAIEPMDVAGNLERVVRWTRRAAVETGAQVIVLPETITTGFAPGKNAAGLWDIVDTLPGRLSEPVQKTAQELGVYVAFATYERGTSRDRLYNSAALIGPNGDILGVYRKTHMFPMEQQTFGGWACLGSDPVVVETPLANIGLTICYDGDFPELFRAEAIMGAEVIVRPSSLLRSFEIWELTNSARAYDNHVYIAAANAIGPDAAGNYYFGHSMIVDPIAHKLAQARGTEEIISATLEPDPIKRVTYGADSPMIFDHMADRNLQAYRNILTAAQSRFEPGRFQREE